MMRTCSDCTYLKGDECIRYEGPQNTACGLLSGSWYKIEDLISALICATQADSDAAGCDNCICLFVQGYNNAFPWGGNILATLSYKIYQDPSHDTMVLERAVGPGDSDLYIQKGALSFTSLYPVISAILSPENPEKPAHTNGFGMDLIIVSGGSIIYARSLADPLEGENSFDDIPVPLPAGMLSVYLVSNQFDTNTGSAKGIVAIGGDRLTGSVVTVQVAMINGGQVNNSPFNWPSEDSAYPDFNYTNFDTDVYGSIATGMDITISVTNNEQHPFSLSFQASVDPSAGFADTVAPGDNYVKTIPLSLQQIASNDFLILVSSSDA